MTAPQIKRARQKLGLSRKDLAERLGVSEWTVRSWELGRRQPCCRFMRAELERVLGQQ